MPRKSDKKKMRLEIFQDITEKNLEILFERLKIIENSHNRLQAALIAYMQMNNRLSEENAKKLFDELSNLHGKIVSLKKR